MAASVPVVPQISDEAKRLLVAAADGDGDILRIPSLAGTMIQAGLQQMTTNMLNRRDVARWEAALKELANLGLVEDQGHKGEFFTVTHAGYELAEVFKERMSSSPGTEDLNP